MMSILGCSSSDVGEILQKLGFRLERSPQPRPEEKPAAEVPPSAPSEAPAAAAITAAEPATAAEPDAGDSAGAGQPVPDTAAAAQGEAAAAAAPEPAREKPAAELKLDEVWRPRRQGRHRDRGRRRPPASDPSGKDDAHPRRGREERHHRPDRHERHERRHGPGGGRRDSREERQRPFRHSASPTPKAGVDPDSPFAALSSLKAALEKQSQE
jgi:ATP-dependent RNA helicase SUPV3L1/SUV3